MIHAQSISRFEQRQLHAYAAGDEGLFARLVQRRMAGEPLSQILGNKPFWKDDFAVTRDVLTPRADSEVLIEEALAALPDRIPAYRFLDIGTGSGCLLLSLLREYSHASGVGVDISPAALQVAQENAQTLGLASRAMFQQGDCAKGLTGAFNLVISNPPYIPKAEIETLMPEVRDYEPHSALDGGEDGLNFYREITESARCIMQPSGFLIFEVGQGQAKAVAAMGENAGWKLRNIRKDYAGIKRAIVMQAKD